MGLKSEFFIISVLVSAVYILVPAVVVAAAKAESAGVVPALYVFGDSLLDSGNNNFLQTRAKANYTPYGVDFPNGKATGRFTNGRTVADFIAKWLKLPYVKPYLGLSDEEKTNITTGVNYASGAAGILPETGSASGKVLSLDKQVNYFKDTVTKDLPQMFKRKEDLSKYLAKSIFVVSIGSNDYINNYLQPSVYNSSKIYTPQQFGALLLDTLKQRLTAIYNLGGRKFVIFGLGPIGCMPATVNSANPKPNTPCLETVNGVINLYNAGLPKLTQQLTSTLKGSTFVHGEVYQINYVMSQNPSKYGFTEGNTPCCVVGGNGTTICLPNQKPCKNRWAHLYYDAFHPVQRVNHIIAHRCFSGSSLCLPINIKSLVEN